MAEFDSELSKIMETFEVPALVQGLLISKGAVALWQFAEYVDDVSQWTSILVALDPPITERADVAKVRKAFKAAGMRDTELSRMPRSSATEDIDAPIDPGRRKTLIQQHAEYYRFQIQMTRQPSDTLLGRQDRER